MPPTLRVTEAADNGGAAEDDRCDRQVDAQDGRNRGDADPDHDAHYGRHHDLEDDIGPARRYAGPPPGDEKVIGMRVVAGQKRAPAAATSDDGTHHFG